MASLLLVSLITGVLALEDGVWQVKPGFVPADRSGLTGPSIREAGIPLLPMELFDAGPVAPVAHYTLETRFHSGPELLQEPAAISFASIGEAWKIYLNGELIDDRLELDDSGRLSARRLGRNRVVPIPSGILRDGENVLIVRLAGDTPFRGLGGNPSLGLYRPAGYLVGPLRELSERRSIWRETLVASWLVFLGVFALLTVPLLGRRTVIFPFGIFTLLLGIYSLMRSSFVLMYVDDAAWVRRVEFSALFLAGSTVTLALQRYAGRARRYAGLRLYSGVSAVFAATVCLAPFPWPFTLLLLWQWLSIAVLAYAIFVLPKRPARASGMLRVIRPGVILVAGAILWDLLSAVFGIVGFRLSFWGLFAATVLFGFSLARRFFDIHREADELNAALRESEARMRSMYEATLEPICVRQGNVVLEANEAFTSLFGYEGVTGKPFTQLFRADTQDAVLAGMDTEQTAYEAVGLRKDGNWFYAELVNKRIDYDGKRAKVTAVHDITAEKESSERLRMRNLELAEMTKTMVDRELYMVELKRQIRSLQSEQNAND